MDTKIIYTSRNLSAVHLLQGMAGVFMIAGTALAFKLVAAPVTSVTSHATHQSWAIALGAMAIITPVLAWLYGRRVVASIAVSQNGQFALIKSASIVGPHAKRWPLSAMKVSSAQTGDTQGEADFGLPRVTLTLDDGNECRKYTLSLKSKEQVLMLRGVLQQRTTANV